MSEWWRRTKDAVCRGLSVFGGLPKSTAIAASLGAVALASAPGGFSDGGDYDPELAVLTATLVALIWYAYFTFRSARPAARVEFSARPSGPGLSTKLWIEPRVRNPMEYPLQVRVDLRVWIDEEKIHLGEFYEEGRPFTVGAQRQVAWTEELDEHLELSEPNEHGVRHPLNADARIAMQVEWIDDLCDRGRTPVQYWHIPLVAEGQLSSVIAPQRIEDLFGHLDTPPE